MDIIVCTVEYGSIHVARRVNYSRYFVFLYRFSNSFFVVVQAKYDLLVEVHLGMRKCHMYSFLSKTIFLSKVIFRNNAGRSVMNCRI
jgi:hypothetical protein